MAAAFFNLNKSDVFKSGGSADHLIKVPKVDDLISQSGLAIYTEVGIQIGETLQYFLTFDDVIKFIHFGKGLGTVTASGIMFSDCDGDIPGLRRFSSAVSGLRGKEQKINIGSMTLTGILTGAQVSIVSEPDTMAQFSFNFAIVNHTL